MTDQHGISVPTHDVDGLVVVGELPLVIRDFTHQPLKLKAPYRQHFCMKSLYVDTPPNPFPDFFNYKIGMTQGYNVNLFTNVPSPRIKEVFARFLSQFNPSDDALSIGGENLQLLSGANPDYETILSRLSEEHGAFVFSTLQVLQAFGYWWGEYKAEQRNLGSIWGDLECYISIIKMGQKQVSADAAELQRLKDCLDHGCFLYSCIHLGFNFANKDFFALNSDLFPRREAGLAVFHPLGLVDLATVTVERPHRSLRFNADAAAPCFWPYEGEGEGPSAVKVYCSNLKTPRTPQIRKSWVSGQIAALSTLGPEAESVPSVFQSHCQGARQLARSYDACINSVRNQKEGTLRFEYVFQGFWDIDLDTMFRILMNHLLSQLGHLTRSVSVDAIPWHLGAEQALKLIGDTHPSRFARTYCAEAYIAYLVDGYDLRCDRKAVRFALGHTLGDAERSCRGSPRMVVPRFRDFRHATWDSLGDAADKHLTFHLMISVQVARDLREALTAMQEDMNLQEEGQIWLKVVWKVMASAVHESRLGVNFVEKSLRLYAGRLGVIHKKPFSKRDVARCLLHPRERRGRGTRGLQECIVRAHLRVVNAGVFRTQKELVDDLVELFGNRFSRRVQVWPLSQPVHAKDEMARLAAVTDDTSSLGYVVGLIRDLGLGKLWYSRLPNDPYDGFDCLAAVQSLIPKVDIRSHRRKEAFACLWFAVTYSAKMQAALNVHMQLDRSRWEDAFTLQAIRIFQTFLVQRTLLVQSPQDPVMGNRQHLFDQVVVPADFRVRLFRMLHPNVALPAALAAGPAPAVNQPVDLPDAPLPAAPAPDDDVPLDGNVEADLAPLSPPPPIAADNQGPAVPGQVNPVLDVPVPVDLRAAIGVESDDDLLLESDAPPPPNAPLPAAPAPDDDVPLDGPPGAAPAVAAQFAVPPVYNQGPAVPGQVNPVLDVPVPVDLRAAIGVESDDDLLLESDAPPPPNAPLPAAPAPDDDVPLDGPPGAAPAVAAQFAVPPVYNQGPPPPGPAGAAPAVAAQVAVPPVNNQGSPGRAGAAPAVVAPVAVPPVNDQGLPAPGAAGAAPAVAAHVAVPPVRGPVWGARLKRYVRPRTQVSVPGFVKQGKRKRELDGYPMPQPEPLDRRARLRQPPPRPT